MLGSWLEPAQHGEHQSDPVAPQEQEAQRKLQSCRLVYLWQPYPHKLLQADWQTLEEQPLREAERSASF